MNPELSRSQNIDILKKKEGNLIDRLQSLEEQWNGVRETIRETAAKLEWLLLEERMEQERFISPDGFVERTRSYVYGEEISRGTPVVEKEIEYSIGALEGTKRSMTLRYPSSMEEPTQYAQEILDISEETVSALERFFNEEMLTSRTGPILRDDLYEIFILPSLRCDMFRGKIRAKLEATRSLLLRLPQDLLTNATVEDDYIPHAPDSLIPPEKKREGMFAKLRRWKFW